MVERDSFYVTLPSNACHDIFPDNDGSNYTVTLSQPIELQGPYEVALAEISYCHTWNNIVSVEDSFDLRNHSHPNDPPTYLKIPTGNYESVDLLVREINALFKSVKIELILHYSSITKRVAILGPGGFSLKFKAPLAYMLGFEPDEWISSGSNPRSKYPCDIYGGQYNFFVYTNIVEAQHVGDYVVPLLRIVKKDGSYGELITLSYNRLHYVPVNKQRIQDIQIELKTDLNKFVRFTYGKTICKLHFRPISKTFI